MKTPKLNGLLAFFATAAMVSCKSDDKKSDDKKPVTETNSTTTTTTITETTTIDNTDRADASGNGANSETRASNATASSKSVKATVKSGTKKDNEDPDILVTRTKDGTDAENHDGNPYTKNDQTPQPTGPPIK